MRSSLLLLLTLGWKLQLGSAIKCVQCSDDDSSSRVDDVGGQIHQNGTTYNCFEVPPPAKPCSADMTSCIVMLTYKPSREVNRKAINIVRTCSPRDLGFDCRLGHPDKSTLSIEICHQTCYSDGCNGASSTLTIINNNFSNYYYCLLLYYFCFYCSAPDVFSIFSY
ncbi:UNVERIFIED_CONTAM: hypothetical protein RMT77_017833 [Armadillidium vulgare]